MTTRREALRALGTMAAIPFLGRVPGDSRAPVVQPTRKLDRIGLAMFTLARISGRDYEGMLRQVAAIGYKDVDMYIYESQRAPAETRGMMERAGLASPAERDTAPA